MEVLGRELLALVKGAKKVQEDIRCTVEVLEANRQEHIEFVKAMGQLRVVEVNN